MADINNIVILTGAGISAESGIATFRAASGLWEEHRIDDVASLDGYARNPELVHQFYDTRRANLQMVAPNAAHRALAHLQENWPGEFSLVTQNVDDLHERAGARDVIHMHGELLSALCTSCGLRNRWTAPLRDRPPCPICRANTLRPDVVWFGEEPYHMPKIHDALRGADLFVAIGTSGSVHPAAGLVRYARSLSVATLELNLQPSHGSRWFHETRYGPATKLVPLFVDEMLRYRAH